jgi:hypothetical protein
MALLRSHVIDSAGTGVYIREFTNLAQRRSDSKVAQFDMILSVEKYVVRL